MTTSMPNILKAFTPDSMVWAIRFLGSCYRQHEVHWAIAPLGQTQRNRVTWAQQIDFHF
jgi:hypothetical protein